MTMVVDVCDEGRRRWLGDEGFEFVVGKSFSGGS